MLIPTERYKRGSNIEVDQISNMYRLIVSVLLLEIIASQENYPPTPYEFRGLWCISQWNNTGGNYSRQLGQAFFYNNGTFTLNYLSNLASTWINHFVGIHQMGDEGTYHVLTDTSQGPINYVNKTSCFWRRQISNSDIVWGRQSNGTCTPTFEFEVTDPWIVYTRNARDCQYIDDENPDQILSDTQFESELIQFDRSLKDSKPQSIVFYGSSSIRLWSTLTTDFSNTRSNVINRGFGGSTLEQCSEQFKRLILPLDPRLLVLYAGENDLAANQTAIDVQSSFRQLIQTARRFFPVLPIVFLSIKPSPSRWNLRDEQNRTNHLIRNDIQAMENVDYIDIVNQMLTANDTPRSELFLSDNLHLNEQGYAILTQAIQDYLQVHGFISHGLINCELSLVVFALNLLLLRVFV